MNTATSLLQFYFHDYETFGIDPIHDRPAQFAGIRTDADFNIIDDPLVVYCKPPSDYLPNPEAVLITGITPQEALKKGLPESQFTAQIYQAFNQPGTCVLGYNNIRFDDEVTRYLFYRNFYPPYDHTWKQDNSRWDLLDIVRTYYALRPEGIQWPLGENGLPSFRLEQVAAANHLSHAKAHDALSDVYATLEIAKLLKSAQPRLFDYLFQLRNKNQVKTSIDILDMTPLVHISGMLGAYRGNTTWVVPIAWHPDNPNAVIVCDLMGNIDPLIEWESDIIKEYLYTPYQELDDDAKRIPLKLIHINKCPIVLPAKALTPDNAERLNIDRNVCLRNLKKAKAHQHLIQQKVMDIFSQTEVTFSEKDVEAQLYDRFLDAADTPICETIRNSSSTLLTSLDPIFKDSRLSLLFFRYKARNFPHLLTEKEQQQWREHCQNKFNESTLRDYVTRLENLANYHLQDKRKQILLKSVYEYSHSIFGL